PGATGQGAGVRRPDTCRPKVCRQRAATTLPLVSRPLLHPLCIPAAFDRTLLKRTGAPAGLPGRADARRVLDEPRSGAYNPSQFHPVGMVSLLIARISTGCSLRPAQNPAVRQVRQPVMGRTVLNSRR